MELELWSGADPESFWTPQIGHIFKTPPYRMQRLRPAHVIRMRHYLTQMTPEQALADG